MATSIGQYAPGFLPREPPPLTEKPGRPEVYRVAKSQTLPKRPCEHSRKTFLPVAALPQWELSVKETRLLGLWGPWWRQVVQGHWLLPPQALWPYQSLFSSLLQLAIRGPLWPVFLHSSAHSGTYRAPLPGVLLYCSACQAHRGPPGWGPVLHFSASGVCWVSLSVVQQPTPAVWGERGYGSSPYTWLSSTTLLPWPPGFPPQAFPTTISSLTSPRSVLSTVNSRPCPGIVPQSLNSRS